MQLYSVDFSLDLTKLNLTFLEIILVKTFLKRYNLHDLSTKLLLKQIQARWDLLVQQEGPSPMAESVMSQTSTSSSSGGGSLHCDPPRDNFPPSPNRRFSRSSADDDDSDPW
jgi:hypothetical protein